MNDEEKEPEPLPTYYVYKMKEEGKYYTIAKKLPKGYVANYNLVHSWEEAKDLKAKLDKRKKDFILYYNPKQNKNSF